METLTQYSERMLDEAGESLRLAFTYFSTIGRVADPDLEEELDHELKSVEVSLGNAMEAMAQLFHDFLDEVGNQRAEQIDNLNVLTRMLRNMYAELTSLHDDE